MAIELQGRPNNQAIRQSATDALGIQTELARLTKALNTASVFWTRTADNFKTLAVRGGFEKTSDYRQLSRDIATLLHVQLKAGASKEEVALLGKIGKLVQDIQKEALTSQYSKGGSASRSTGKGAFADVVISSEQLGQSVSEMPEKAYLAMVDAIRSTSSITDVGDDFVPFKIGGGLASELGQGGIFSNMLEYLKGIFFNTSSQKESFPMSPGAKALSTSTGIQGTAMKAGVGKGAMGVAGAVAGVVGALIAVAKKIVDILAKSSPAFGAIMELLQLAFDLFFLPIGNALAMLLFPIMEDLIDLMLDWNDFMSDPGEAFKKIIDFLTPLLMNVAKGIAYALGIPFDDIIKIVKDVISFFEEDFYPLLKEIKGHIESITQTVGATMNKGKEMATTVTTSVMGASAPALKKVISFLGIPMAASGGYFPPTAGGHLVNVAERGYGEEIGTPAQMRAKYGNSGGNTFVFNGPVYGMDDFERQVGRIIDMKIYSSTMR